LKTGINLELVKEYTKEYIMHPTKTVREIIIIGSNAIFAPKFLLKNIK